MDSLFRSLGGTGRSRTAGAGPGWGLENILTKAGGAVPELQGRGGGPETGRREGGQSGWLSPRHSMEDQAARWQEEVGPTLPPGGRGQSLQPRQATEGPGCGGQGASAGRA